MSAIRGTLPPFMSAWPEIGALLDALGAELDRLEAGAETLCLRTAASTADDPGLTRWERDLGLSVRSDLGTATRRTEVLAALDFFTTCTPHKLRSMLAHMTGGVVTLTESPAAGTISAAVTAEDAVPADLRGVQNALRRAVPAHLGCGMTATARMDGTSGGARCLTGSVSLRITG